MYICNVNFPCRITPRSDQPFEDISPLEVKHFRKPTIIKVCNSESAPPDRLQILKSSSRYFKIDLVSSVNILLYRCSVVQLMCSSKSKRLSLWCAKRKWDGLAGFLAACTLCSWKRSQIVWFSLTVADLADVKMIWQFRKLQVLSR